MQGWDISCTLNGLGHMGIMPLTRWVKYPKSLAAPFSIKPPIAQLPDITLFKITERLA